MKTEKEAIGGYFELELNSGKEYHARALRLNSGRNALRLAVELNKIDLIYIPRYTCSVVPEILQRSGCEYEYYDIGEHLYPKLDVSLLKPGAWVLFTNYFGLCDEHLLKLQAFNPRLVVDNSQAFFSMPVGEHPTFYSPRKFFGVPDGAYLYSRGQSPSKDLSLARSSSSGRSSHLLIRADLGAEAGYQDFKNNEAQLSDETTMMMSELTQKILDGIDYQQVRQIRQRNFRYLHKYLEPYNELILPGFKNVDADPLCYPLLTRHYRLRERLIERRIFVPCYWDNVRQTSAESSWERYLTDHLTALPLDQRYDESHMRLIVEAVQQILAEGETA